MSQNKETGSKHRGSIAELRDVSFHIPGRLLFSEVNLVVRNGENIAIIGESGSGKSTLLRILAGQQQPDSGRVIVNPQATKSYVPQDIESVDIDPNTTIRDLFFSSRNLLEIDRRKTELEAALARTTNQKLLDSLLREYEEVTETFEAQNGYGAEADMNKILAGLKIDPEHTPNITPATNLRSVSSGQRTRLLIGQALFADADLLLMDDPTSHLDVSSVDWLSKFLRASRQSSVIATNNIPFINSTVNKILEITDFGRMLSFEGNYQQYQEKRARLLEAERAAAKKVQGDRDRLQGTLDYFRERNVFQRSADMAQVGRAMQTRVNRLTGTLDALPGSQQVDRVERVPNLVFKSERRSGQNVATIDKVSRYYGEHLALDLSRNSFTIERGEIFLVSGENGSGKSTLLRMIADHVLDDKFKPSGGRLALGASVDLAYFAPDYLGIGNAGSILQDVKNTRIGTPEGEALNALSYWGFPKDGIRQRMIEQLSSGEKKQLGLAKVMVKHPNLLILDEPTDYLKPAVVDRLVAAIKGFDGTTILVSHDSTFTRKLPVSRELQLPAGIIQLKK